MSDKCISPGHEVDPGNDTRHARLSRRGRMIELALAVAAAPAGQFPAWTRRCRGPPLQLGLTAAQDAQTHVRDRELQQEESGLAGGQQGTRSRSWWSAPASLEAVMSADATEFTSFSALE
jgi:hypothetical protein